jgi:BirA family biotin operon repressor/biotin-[acetyl-CoA-carboxylase] ligase
MWRAAAAFDGVPADELAQRCAVPALELFEEVGSTMDVAHELAAAGSPSGTLVLADRQVAGRGRGGRSWTSVPGASVTFTLIERPTDERAISVLSLRLGLAMAPVLERWVDGGVALKWPNDLFTAGGKVAGILTEARWRHQRPEWVAIGIGINVGPPDLPGTAGLAPGAARVEILAALVPAIRAAARATGELAPPERSAWSARDWVRGRELVLPARGTAAGIGADGALIVRTAGGLEHCTAGSLVLAESR